MRPKPLIPHLFGTLIVILCAGSVCAAWPARPAIPIGQTLTGKVIHIADGDTLTVLVDHQPIRVRMFGIDAPEKHQPFGARAKQYAASLAFGKTVTVIEHGHDRYGRIIGEVILPDGRNMSREITGAGYAWWYRRYAPHDAELERLEREAREARRGLWADPNPVPPWEFRRPLQ